MIQMEFPPEAMEALHYERYHHPHPRVQRKLEALWLKSQKLPHQEIARLTGISIHTVTSYVRAYKQGGLEKLKSGRFYKPQSQ